MLMQSLVLFCFTLITITGGKEAPLGKYAHHVSIQHKGEHTCSGSIINERHILTSYSCIISSSVKNFTAVAGTNSLRTGGDSYKIQEIILPVSSYDDIAILRTSNNINFRRGVHKIDIDNHNEYVINSSLTVLGWERPLPGQNRSAMLQEFSYRLYDQDICRMKNNLFGRKFLCIVDPTGQSLCNMDHGGGIIADGYLIGIYLNRQSCVDGGEPKAHTPIYEYLDWIKSNSIVPKVINSGGLETGKSCIRNHDAPYGTHKYHVSVRRSNKHICSGSIINKRYILTSQLCVKRDSPKDLHVIVGINSLKNRGVLYGVEKIISHPGDDDFISLLQTNRDIEFNNFIQPIAMTSYNYESIGHPVIFTAFERPVSGKFTNDKLQAFSWKIYDLKKCAKKFKDNFTQSIICTTNPCHERICNMDYGGAVVANGVQIGMKFHPGGCIPNFPIVHHRIHHYLEWIKQNSGLNKVTRPSSSYGRMRNFKLGHNAPDGAFPYHVSIRRNNKHICSGSIINKRHVLTSMNCTLSDQAKNLSVIAGTNSLIKAGDLYHVQEIIPTYDYKYDIAILRTSKDIIFNDNILSIPIGTSDYDTYSSERLIHTGWERQIDGKYKNDRLQQVVYQTYDRNLCKQVIPFLNEAYMCSINPTYERACYMDYGGPIVVKGVQVGLNPFGVKCENNDKPHLYLPLQKHSTWIQRNSRI